MQVQKCSRAMNFSETSKKKNAMCVAGTGGGVFIHYLFSVFLNCAVNVQFKSTSDH